MRTRASLVALGVLIATSVHASERRDILAGDANWHRYRFHVVTSQVAVRQHVTVLWDNSQAGMLVAIYNIDNPNSPRLTAISSGNDRLVALDVGLLAGSYQLVVAAVVTSTHYHLNVTYGSNELLFQDVRGRPTVTDLYMERLIEEDLAPHLAKLSAALNR